VTDEAIYELARDSWPKLAEDSVEVVEVWEENDHTKVTIEGVPDSEWRESEDDNRVTDRLPEDLQDRENRELDPIPEDWSGNKE